MIVRVFSEGQYRVPESAQERLHELDHAACEALEAGDEPGFHDRYGKLLDYIRSAGELLADDELVGSDVMLPPADATLEEAREDLSGHELIPE